MLSQMSQLERSVTSRLAQVAEGKKSGEGGGRPKQKKKRTPVRRPWARPVRDNLAPRHAGALSPAASFETPELSAQDGAALRRTLEDLEGKLSRLQVKVERVGEATGL